MSESDLAEMRTQADRLGFDLPESILEEILETATAGEEHAAASVRTSEGAGHRSEDEENALLAVFDEPRVRTDSGPLFGKTLAVKDNIAVSDLEMTCGSAAYSVVPSFTAPAVDRLLEAGAGLVGKANMEPFAMGPTGEFSDFGHVTNPIDPDIVAGGSSSGSAAAVAAGTVDVALGSDTGGSIRIPSACCGIVGVKPSHRLVPRNGFVDFAPSLDTIGPMTRDVSTAASALAAMAGRDPLDPTSADRSVALETLEDLDDVDGLTVGIPDTPFERASDEVADAVRTVTDRLSTLGIETESVELDLGDTEAAYLNIGAAEFSWLVSGNGVTRGQGTGYDETLRQAFESAREAGLGEHVARRILPPAFLDMTSGGASYAAAREEGLAFSARLETAFEAVDALVTPTLRVRPPAVETVTTRADLLPILGNTAPFNIAGTPAVTVPVTSVDGLPVSAQAVAPQFEDARALRVARALERVAD
ncbi:amidase [Natronorubrum texcoconense]|uniref:Aspartyl-tRNA(Asn)/glutamyl-tRNA(Gln) amidotransferase subunit A n=1 Tax=Natronorubrum texcoconense TaxID=1095776 RepID=A0A1G9CY62_9EURY|nr:amidase [Natronorubrum texcoconense]SDK56553.1 aspartyl-tRNA(Asn)/glutamyl-tRNA(Gln) amidotransferase subunit A [Natronorubrum texcoconense]